MSSKIQLKKSETFTYQTRLPLDISCEAILGEYADIINRLERKLFADIASGKKANDLKSTYLSHFHITARQFNAIRVGIEGKIASIQERRAGSIVESKNRIADLEKTIQKLEKHNSKPQTIHQKKRRLHRLQSNHNSLCADHQAGKIRLCFGSKKLFHAQFALTENGYASHNDWVEEWHKERNSSFFLLGSKDETGGNQTCTAIIQEDESLSLRLRLPDALAIKYGKYLIISNVRFQYGHNVIVENLKSCKTRSELLREKNAHYQDYGEAISYRIKRDKKGWILFATTSQQAVQWVTRKELGAIGVDINADHLAVTETDRFGNPIQHRTIPLVCYGKTQKQSQAMIGDAATEIANWAIKSQKPIVLEKLDFQNKKTALKESGFKKHSRMLSSFAYKAIINSIKSRGWRFGVHVEEVNPAFTSVIGRVKYAKRYGLSIHEAAALCIAQRYLGISERLPRHEEQVPDGKGGHVAFSLPVRRRDQHVWTQWRKIKKKLSAALAAHFLAKKRSSSRPPPACCDREVLQDFVGETPTRESSTALFG